MNWFEQNSTSSEESESLRERLKKVGVSVTLTDNRIRVSPAIYNIEEDMDLLASVLIQAPA